jgi:hypothetical protein
MVARKDFSGFHASIVGRMPLFLPWFAVARQADLVVNPDFAC